MINQQKVTIESKDMVVMVNCLIGLLEKGFLLPPLGAIVVMEETIQHIKKFHGMTDIKKTFKENEKHD